MKQKYFTWYYAIGKKTTVTLKENGIPEYQKNSKVFLFTFPIPFFPIADSLLVLYHRVEAASQTLALLLGDVGFYFALCMRKTSMQWELHIHMNGSLKLLDSKCHKNMFIFRKHSNCSRPTTESSNLGYGNIL